MPLQISILITLGPSLKVDQRSTQGIRCEAQALHLDQEHIDPACTGVRHIIGSALRGTGARAALSNSFAFGGSNAVLAFRRPA